MQFDADNPGVWPFHCHIAWHLSQVRYSITNFMPIPKPYNTPAFLAQIFLSSRGFFSARVWGGIAPCGQIMTTN
jgi:Multicopper oxidase